MKRAIGLTVVMALGLVGCAPSPSATGIHAQWETVFESPISLQASDDDVAVIYLPAVTTLAAVDLSDGGIRWSRPFSPSPSDVAIHGDTVTFVQPANEATLVGGIDLGSGEPTWTRIIGAGTYVGAFADGRIVTDSEDEVLVVSDATVRVAGPWQPAGGCELLDTRVVDDWIAALSQCDDDSTLHRLDTGLNEVWAADVGTARSLEDVNGQIIAVGTGSDLWVVNDSGALLETLSGTVVGAGLGGPALREAFDDAWLSVEHEGVSPIDHLLSANLIAEQSVTRLVVSDGAVTGMPTFELGAQPLLRRLADGSYLLTRLIDDGAAISRLTVGSVVGADEPVVAWPDSLPVSLTGGVRGAVFAVQSEVPGVSRLVLTDADSGASLARIDVAWVGSVERAREAVASIPLREGEERDDLSRWTSERIASAMGECVIAVSTTAAEESASTFLVTGRALTAAVADAELSKRCADD